MSIKSSLAKQLEIRYSKELYLGYGKGSLYHFLYAYKRFFIEIIKSLKWCFSSLKKTTYSEQVAIYATLNQFKALTNAEKENVFRGDLVTIESISFVASLLRLFTWTAKCFVYPFYFFTTSRKEGLYFLLLAPVMRQYNFLIAETLRRSNVERVLLSNDHAGDVFLLSIVLRDFHDISVVYVQHGAVKESFPDNYFDEIYVYDKRYADIYYRLSRNPHVNINILPNIGRSASSFNLKSVDYLVCLSHQFPLFNILKALYLLDKEKNISFSMRFHPSDKLMPYKFALIKLFFSKVQLSSSSVHYIDDFNRANVVLCASSSLLVDAYNNGFREKIIWVKPFGLEWDYYKLEGKLIVVSNVKQIDVKKQTKFNAL